MFWITHFIPDGLPKYGMRKLFFYTNQEDPNEFFWGTDNNPFTREEVNEMVERKKIIPIPHKLPLTETDTLYIDSKGTMWLANYIDSDINKKEVGFYDEPIGKFFQDLKAPE